MAGTGGREVLCHCQCTGYARYTSEEEDERSNHGDSNGRGVGWRHLLAVVAFFGFFSCMSQRVAFTISLVDMVNSTQSPDQTRPNMTMVDQCPMSGNVSNMTTLPRPSGGEFNWDSSTQSLLVGSMFYGYMVTQLPGGMLAEKIGPRIVFGLTGLLSGIVTMVTPFIARWDVKALLASRILLGLIQGPLYSANQALWAQWAPVLERSLLFTLSTSGANFAYFTSYIASGYLCETELLGGWPLPLFITGAIGCVWFFLWVFLARDRPSQHPCVSEAECRYIEASLQQNHVPHRYTRPPWKDILRSRAVWSLIFFSLCDGMGFFILFSVVPFYLKDLLHYDIKQDGIVSALPYLVNFGVSLIAAPLADCILTRQWLSTTAVRKVFTLIGDGGMGLFMLGIALADCDHLAVVVLMTVGYGLYGFSRAGYMVVTLDFAPRYAGTLLGLVNPFSDIGGVLAPILANLLTQGQPSRSKWQQVFFMAAGILWAGTLVFLLLGTSKPQPWAEDKDKVKDERDSEARGQQEQDDRDQWQVQVKS